MKKALLVRAGALGDVILLRRALSSLRRAGFEVTLVAPEPAGTALVGQGPEEAARLVPWDRADMARLVAGTGGGSLLAAQERFDLAFSYSRNLDLAAALRAFARKVVVHDPAPEGVHASHWLARPLADHGIPLVEPQVLVPSEEERRHAAAVLDRLPAGFLALHPGSGSPAKNWPVARFAELVERLSAGRGWLLSVGPAEEAILPHLASLPGAIVASGLPARVLAAALSRAGVYVGNDSGVTHLAAAWEAPVVALFGPTDPALWAPVGPVVRTVRAVDRTLQSIDVERVVETASSIRRRLY